MDGLNKNPTFSIYSDIARQNQARRLLSGEPPKDLGPLILRHLYDIRKRRPKMKKSIVTILVLPCLFYMFIAADFLLPGQGKSAGDRKLKPADNNPKVGKYGNLLRWSETSFHNESYELRYEYTDPRTRKRVVKRVSAVGNESAIGLLPFESDSKFQLANTKEILLKTEDGLTLTRLFTLNKSGEELESRLIVRNDSQRPVRLLSISFKIFLAAHSVINDSRGSVKTRGRRICSDDGSCLETTAYGTDCHPGACPPPHDPYGIRSYPPDINVTKVSSAGNLAITYSWVSRNMPPKSLLPEETNIYLSQLSRIKGI